MLQPCLALPGSIHKCSLPTTPPAALLLWCLFCHKRQRWPVDPDLEIGMGSPYEKPPDEATLHKQQQFLVLGAAATAGGKQAAPTPGVAAQGGSFWAFGYKITGAGRDGWAPSEQRQAYGTDSASNDEQLKDYGSIENWLELYVMLPSGSAPNYLFYNDQPPGGCG